MAEHMQAMVSERPGAPLAARVRPVPTPAEGQVLLRVRACAVCRTDVHLAAGELPAAVYPIIPGHEIVGEVVDAGRGVADLRPGDRVGVPWLGWTCGRCRFCREDRENLCDAARFTGCQIDGGYAEYCVADARYAFPLPAGYPDEQAAPLLCAGVIGFRALRLAGDAPRLGFYGFGAAAHVLLQIARHEGREVFAFTRPGDTHGQAFARELGAAWAGDSTAPPPAPLDAALIFAPVGDLVPQALRAVRKAGVVVCAGIHMSDVPAFPYRWLWEERVVRSVANLTRADARAFLDLAPRIPIRSTVQLYPLADANRALDDLRAGRVRGVAVLRTGVPPANGGAVAPPG